jgi:hypothetical protein
MIVFSEAADFRKIVRFCTNRERKNLRHLSIWIGQCQILQDPKGECQTWEQVGEFSVVD